MKEKINGCCKQPGNLYSADKDSTGRVTVWRCRTCGRNHYRLIAEPGEFGIMDMIAIQKLINDLMARRDGEKIDPEEIRVILAKR